LAQPNYQYEKRQKDIAKKKKKEEKMQKKNALKGEVPPEGETTPTPGEVVESTPE
jgi:hypothetical protein